MNPGLKLPLTILSSVAILFGGANVASALSDDIREAINGLPLGDQVNLVANRVHELELKDKIRDACDEEKRLVNLDGTVTFGGRTYSSFDDALATVNPEYGVTSDGTPVEMVLEQKAQWEEAKAMCEQLMAEYENF